MLGRLLHLGSGGPGVPNQNPNVSPQPVSSLESVQEDIHTRSLLFPDINALLQQRGDQFMPLSAPSPTLPAISPNAFDFSDDIDLDVRDVRILIMQDTLGPTHTSLLFDSKPLPPKATIPSSEFSSKDYDARTNPLSPSRTSTGQSWRSGVLHSGSPQQRQGAFDRRASVHGRSQSSAETDSQRATREYREELAVFSSCIFGNSELMAYKGTSTKVHVVPVESRISDQSASVFGDGRSSVGRSSTRSANSHSHSPQNVSPTYNPPNPFQGGISRLSDRKKVLITRLFPVNISNEDNGDAASQNQFADDNNGFPFPPTSDDGPGKKKKTQPKQRRTPMYAVVLVVQLPSSTSRLSSTAQKLATRESGSFNDAEFMPSSYSSTRLSGWTATGISTYGEGTDSSYSIDVEDKIDALTQHWDVIMRTLTNLQSVIASILHVMLKEVDVSSPGPLPMATPNSGTRPVSFYDRRSGEFSRGKPSKGTTKLVSLWPNCLAEDETISREVEAARNRIVRGICASRVVTGQGRWGIWRDEAIWSSKWAASLERGQFIDCLITGFLATHTDWLQALAPASYRKRMLLRRQSRNEEDLSLPARTVIVSADKMAARRLIFLLTAFLPASQQIPTSYIHRPGTSTSLGIFSNSPPSVVAPLLREESLRRKINRRTGGRRGSHSRTVSQSTKTVSVPAQLAHLSNDRPHERRASDAASIRTTSLAISGSDAVSRKSSAATTTTVVPEAALPHYSSLQRVESRRKQRPGSSGSVAADDLKRSLQRVESNSQGGTVGVDGRNSGLKWGSLIGGLWASRRQGSIDAGHTIQDGTLRSPIKPTPVRSNKLAEMVRDVSVVEEGEPLPSQDPLDTTIARDFGSPLGPPAHGRPSFSQSDRTPDPNGAFESPVKTTINADDGVIDVDVPFPDYLTSFESTFSSPSSSGYLSTPGLSGGVESFEHSGRVSTDGDLPQNSAGWLDRYHPDFSLQAIPPQENLLEQVKASLRAEPTPSAAIFPKNGSSATERWVDIGSALIADATTGSVTHLLYRRLVRPKVVPERSGYGQGSLPNLYTGVLLTPSVLPYDTPLEEEFIEEQVLYPDEVIAETLERAVSFNIDTSKDSSSHSSQTQTDGVEPWSRTKAVTAGEALADASRLGPSSPEYSRGQCKTVVLSALEELIRDVVDKRENPGASQQERSTSNRYRHSVLRHAIREWIATSESAEL